MKKTLFAAAILGLALTAPANAMDMAMKCDDASMMKMQTDMTAMTDPTMSANKDMAMKEMEMAKTSMAAGKTDECTMHMRQAMAATMCNEAGMTKMQTDMGAMTDATKKDAAMKEMEMARTAMTAGKMDECMMSMGKAMEGSMTTQ